MVKNSSIAPSFLLFNLKLKQLSLNILIFKQLNLFTEVELIEELLKEHSKRQCDKIVKYIGNDSTKFAHLIEVFLAGSYRITQRAAWPLSCCVEENSRLINPHLNSVLKFVEKPDASEAVKRNVVRLLQFIEIPKRNQGRVANICFNFFRDKDEAIAVRVFSMTVLANLSKEIPELKNELIPLIEDELPFASAGFISRGRKLLKQLKS